LTSGAIIIREAYAGWKRTEGAYMKVVIDKTICTGCGACVAICPAIFELQDDLAVKIRGENKELPVDYKETCRKAAETCPVETPSQLRNRTIRRGPYSTGITSKTGLIKVGNELTLPHSITGLFKREYALGRNIRLAMTSRNFKREVINYQINGLRISPKVCARLSAILMSVSRI
jgi:ferredoxin